MQGSLKQGSQRYDGGRAWQTQRWTTPSLLCARADLEHTVSIWLAVVLGPRAVGLLGAAG